MTIRTFEPGDEAAQVAIYNEACATLPKFKPATVEEVARRCQASDFDPQMRFFALAAGQPVAYATFHANGRVSFPWCRSGHESLAVPLLQTVLQAMRKRGLRKAFASYRADWTAQQEFFLAHGFIRAREMVNFVVDMADTPTPAVRRSSAMSPLAPRDLPALVKLAGETLRTTALPELEKHFFHNPYFSPESTMVLRNRTDASLEAVGMLIANASYANAKQIDPAMPCFRLGAFGTEGMQCKRVNGLFSFVARAADANRLGLELLSHAAFRLRETDVDAYAAQVPSDVPHMLRFYQHHFRLQGGFPMLERTFEPA